MLSTLLPDEGFVDSSYADRVGEERTFGSFDQAATEAGFSRILGGIHFPMGNEGGQQVGRCVAEAGLALVDH